jgi:hypothetical protein
MDANERQVDAAAGDGPSFDDLLFDDTLDDLNDSARNALLLVADSGILAAAVLTCSTRVAPLR